MGDLLMNESADVCALVMVLVGWLIDSAKARLAVKTGATDADCITIAHLIDSGDDPICEIWILSQLINYIGETRDLLGDLINMDVCGSGAGF
jgi:hypothetical protein